MDPRVELRRDPGPDLSDVGEDAALVERIRDEIRSGGPMPFARFMALALYDPDGGYYRSAQARPGRGADFLTAPELHPIFGETLAAALLDTWERLGRPDPFVLQEHGAGEGALAMPLLATLATTPLAGNVRYDPVEVDPRRSEALRRRLVDSGLASALAESPPTRPFVGMLVANEVLDALPVHRVRQRGDRLVEIAVALDGTGAFVEAEIAPTTPALAKRLAAEGIVLVDGQTAEICLALDAWVTDAATALDRGVLLLIDYGAPATELYDPIRRRDGTLRAYVRQQVHADPLRHIGRQDLTAHVDVTAVTRAAEAAGLTMLGVTTQAEMLMSLGIESRLQAAQADPTTSPEAYLLLRASLMRLLDPAAMGRFRVMAYGRGLRPPTAPGEPPLSLFRFRLPTRPGRTKDGPD